MDIDLAFLFDEYTHVFVLLIQEKTRSRSVSCCLVVQSLKWPPLLHGTPDVSCIWDISRSIER